jgi:uncharacterized protein YndB with AHSA1/START domain
MSEPANDLTFETDIDAPPEKVWRALTTPALREAWLGTPEAGDCEVAAADPPRRLDLVWPTREGESLISFEIAPGEEGGARLTVVHRAPVRVAALAECRQTAPASGWRMAA